MRLKRHKITGEQSFAHLLHLFNYEEQMYIIDLLYDYYPIAGNDENNLATLPFKRVKYICEPIFNNAKWRKNSYYWPSLNDYDRKVFALEEKLKKAGYLYE